MSIVVFESTDVIGSMSLTVSNVGAVGWETLGLQRFDEAIELRDDVVNTSVQGRATPHGFLGLQKFGQRVHTSQTSGNWTGSYVTSSHSSEMCILPSCC